MDAIVVKDLGKAYKQYPNRWDRLIEWLVPYSKKRHKLKWVLQNLSFSVRPGEAVGIIGVNGAGKSTLLKMITGTTQPTIGEVQMNGRVAALLELGMGFHGDFTGRQNAIMAGQLLGLTLAEVSTLMPEIESFAEIGDYMDQPVRMYSSGMQMRLAFSVATAIRPDVLIVDEALSVGDAYFQHKSFERIREFRRQGTTLLIVSHDKSAIQSICDRAILLSKGAIAIEGKPEEVMDFYNALLADHQNQEVKQEVSSEGITQTISGTGEATVERIGVYNKEGKPIEAVDVGQSVTLRVSVLVKKDIPRLIFGYGIKDRLGQVVYGTNTDLKKQPIEDVKAGSRYVFDISFVANLGPGSYSIQTALVSTDSHLVNNYEWRDLAMVFHVININKTHFAGCAWMDPIIEICPQ
ncbi:ABC transporter ATP-binding protein [Pseudomonas sp. CFBP 8758]|uniref:ABC transporter ATP-binding protein n=1 Tax=Pseudomonas sp. CFBP 8758 TaxID=2775286 RepID=UPI00177BA3CA|nr:ABC transporter ATP-binding protein [Pseudomonas sp. CFBP 8758]MBD8595457.1 ABC transporter ATP-binding protein [Pseudomonas sp. CFBP 8758]